jgi:hypothetical protein
MSPLSELPQTKVDFQNRKFENPIRYKVRSRVAPEALILNLDDDEFVVIKNTAHNLYDIAQAMQNGGVCAIGV